VAAWVARRVGSGATAHSANVDQVLERARSAEIGGD
jgi:hypothetical protein